MHHQNTKSYKGIILAGGSGTRLAPATSVISKQLLPIYDKPMIYYPLATLMLAQIRDILIISTPRDIPMFQQLLGDGSNLGIHLSYEIQNEPNGIAYAMILAQEFLSGSGSILVLGDNIFYSNQLSEMLINEQNNHGASIFAYHVHDPERYGVVIFDKQTKEAIDLIEKPTSPVSSYAITGIYVYDNMATEYAKTLSPSKRGELEITDLNKIYMQNNQLHVKILPQGSAWLDTGTPESMLDASNFIANVEKRQDLKIGCIEEIAYRNKWIDKSQLEKIIIQMNATNNYTKYLKRMILDDWIIY